MKGKILFASLLTAVLLIAIASAFTVSPTIIELSKTVSSVNFTVDNTLGVTPITIPAFSDIDDGFGNIIDVTTSATSVAAGAKTTVTVFYTSLPENLALGILPKNGQTITLVSGAESKNLTLHFKSEFCEGGYTKDGKYTDTLTSKTYELTMAIDEINIEGFGSEDDNEWYPLDNIELDIELKNKGNEDIDDIMIEVCLYDEIEDNCVIDESDFELDDNFNLKDGDKKNVLVTYQVDPDEVEPGTYTLYAKAFSDKLDEENLCLEDSQEITIVEEDSFVILGKTEIPETVACGAELAITADLWNVGESDEDDVSMLVTNKELGIKQEVSVGSINNWDKEQVSFNIAIPAETKEGKYKLTMEILDEDGD
ncbi:MAG: putative S-layer protein, partial [Nanoarchaeota archaeon]